MSPSDVADPRQEAASLRRAGRSVEAMAVIEAALGRHPDAWPLWHDLGLALASDGRPEDAVKAHGEALRLGGGELGAVWVNVGNALRGCGRRVDAAAAYRCAIEREPDLAAAHYNLHAVVYEDAAPDEAIASLRRALALRPEHLDTRFYLGALLTLHEVDEGAADLVSGLPEACDFLVSSLSFAEERTTAETRLFADTFETLRFALAAAAIDGPVIELGVRRGTSLRFLAKLADEVHGFDSFEGLPAPWGGQPAGLYSAAGALPSVPPNVTLHPGWFADVLPGFVSGRTQPLRLVNVDCDLYGSTVDALDALAPVIGDGTVLVFDEYLCNPGWEQEEHRALVELAERHGWSYRYLAFSLFTKQAVVRIGCGADVIRPVR